MQKQQWHRTPSAGAPLDLSCADAQWSRAPHGRSQRLPIDGVAKPESGAEAQGIQVRTDGGDEPPLLRKQKDTDDAHGPQAQALRSVPALALVHQGEIGADFQAQCDGLGFAQVKILAQRQGEATVADRVALRSG